MGSLVSVIVPVYNAERYLERCVKSILSQTYHNIEVILIDDGSKDSSVELCDSFGRDERVRVFHKENAGVSAARNDGVRMAKGDYISFVDSDDIIQPEMISTLVTYLEKNCLDIVSTSYQKFDDVNQIQEYLIGENKIFTKEEALLRALDRWKYHMFTIACGGVLRACIAKNIRFDENLTHSEDSKYIFDYLSMCSRIGYIDAKYYCYYQNNSGAVATSVGKSKSQLSIIQAYKYMYDNTVKTGNEHLEQSAKECMKRTLAERACAVDWTDFRHIRHIVKEFIIDILFEKRNTLKFKIKICLRLFGIWKHTDQR